jgi:hypothetical protein
MKGKKKAGAGERELKLEGFVCARELHLASERFTSKIRAVARTMSLRGTPGSVDRLQ